MKILIQRVSTAKVVIEDRVVGSIGAGAVVFVGITHADTFLEAQWLALKLIQLRMFQDEQGKMNRSLVESKGEVLVVSQFTLYAECSEGRRPSFTKAAPPKPAEELYEKFVELIRQAGITVQTGIFGGKMAVSLVNDGPVTFMLEKESQTRTQAENVCS